MACWRALGAGALFSLLPATTLYAQAAPGQAAPAPERRGPFEVREQWLLAQPRLTLPVLSPDPLARGSGLLRLDFDWGNDFGRRPGRYFIDGEHTALALTARRGFRDDLTLGIRLPLLHRGGGILDRFIDAWHRIITNRLGLPDNGRPLYPRDRLVVAGFRDDGSPLGWTGTGDTGLGKLELQALWSPLRRPAARLTGSLAGYLALPTGTGQFKAGGVEAGAQMLGALGLGRRFDVYLGAGAAASSSNELQRISYGEWRGYSFLALEWRLGRKLSLLAQADGASRLATNIEGYPSVESYVRLGLKRDFGGRLRAEAGFTENMTNQQATTDFGLYFALARGF